MSASTFRILWPSLVPPDPAVKPTLNAPVDPNERLFVTIASGDATLPLLERVQTIYPRYLVAEPVAGPPGLTFRGFRDDTPYQGEDLVFEFGSARAFSRPLLAQGRHQFRRLHAGTAYRQCRRNVAFSARLADRLAKRRQRNRPPDRATASRKRNRSLSRPDRRRGWAIREYKNGALFRFPETAPR